MAITKDITAGIKAIKIAKEDALLNDISAQLQEAQVLRIKFDDIGIQQFEILSIAEYPDYYLYYVKPAILGTYNNTFLSPISSDTGGVGGSGYVVAGNMVVNAYPQYSGFIKTVNNSNSSVYSYNSGTGLFTLSTPQKQPYAVKLNFTSSVWSNSNSAGTIRLFVSGSSALGISGTGVNISLPANSSGSSNAKIISGSLTFVVDSLQTGDWGYRFINYYGSNTFYMPTSSMSFSFESYITSSTDTNGVTTVLEPYTSENIANSEYNVVINNAVEARPNAFYMDVDYSSNAIVAVNEEAILDGSATRAPVQYSNYTTARITNPRYYGSRNTSPDFNVGVGNLEPAVESDGTYFAYFDWVGGTTPEIIDKAGFHIKYLIDENSNVYTPNLTSSYYYNLIDSFNANNKVNVLFQAGETSGNVDNLQGIHSVIRPGVLGRAIVFSQTGSNQGALSSINFTNSAVTHNYAGVATLTNDTLIPNINSILDIDSISVSPTDLSWNTTNNYAAVTVTDNTISIAPKMSITYELRNEPSHNSGQGTFTFEKSTNGGSNWSSYASQSVVLDEGWNGISYQSKTLSITAPYEPAVSGSLYRVKFTFNTIPPATAAEFEILDGSFAIIQNPSYGGTATSGSGQVYWTTGSNSKNVLTGSQFTAAIYGATQNEVANSGYDVPYLPFNINIGDEIRFQASENNIYQIIGVNAPTNNTSNKLYLTLDKNITTGTNVNSFLIRRLNPNPNFVLVDALKDNNTGGGSGFLLPEYTSENLLNKFDEIIKNLTEKGLI